MQNINLNFVPGFINWLGGATKESPKKGKRVVDAVIPQIVPTPPAHLEIPPAVTASLSSAMIPTPEVSVGAIFSTPVVVPDLVDRAVTVVKLPEPPGAFLYERILQRFTLRTISYLVFLAAAVACVAYLWYSWRIKRERETLPSAETKREISQVFVERRDVLSSIPSEGESVVKVPVEQESALDPILPEEKSDAEVASEGVISQYFTKERLLGLGVLGVVCVAAGFFMGGRLTRRESLGVANGGLSPSLVSGKKSFHSLSNNSGFLDDRGLSVTEMKDLVSARLARTAASIERFSSDRDSSHEAERPLERAADLVDGIASGLAGASSNGFGSLGARGLVENSIVGAALELTGASSNGFGSLGVRGLAENSVVGAAPELARAPSSRSVSCGANSSLRRVGHGEVAGNPAFLPTPVDQATSIAATVVPVDEAPSSRGGSQIAANFPERVFSEAREPILPNASGEQLPLRLTAQEVDHNMQREQRRSGSALSQAGGSLRGAERRSREESSRSRESARESVSEEGQSSAKRGQSPVSEHSSQGSPPTESSSHVRPILPQVLENATQGSMGPAMTLEGGALSGGSLLNRGLSVNEPISELERLGLMVEALLGPGNSLARGALERKAEVASAIASEISSVPAGNVSKWLGGRLGAVMADKRSRPVDEVVSVIAGITSANGAPSSRGGSRSDGKVNPPITTSEHSSRGNPPTGSSPHERPIPVGPATILGGASRSGGSPLSRSPSPVVPTGGPPFGNNPPVPFSHFPSGFQQDQYDDVDRTCGVLMKELEAAIATHTPRGSSSQERLKKEFDY